MPAHDHGPDAGHRAARSAGAGLLAIGGLLLATGGWQLGVEVFQIPGTITRAVADWWGVLLLLTGGWLVTQGRRALGLGVALLAAIVLIDRHVPAELFWPLLLVGVGVAVLSSSVGPSRRWFDAGPGMALFDDRRVVLGRGAPRTLTAVFGEVEASLGPDDDGGPIACLSVFGDVDLVVPYDVAVEMRQTAVFGDVRAPDPPRGRVTRTLVVRGTSVFGDVRVRRA